MDNAAKSWLFICASGFMLGLSQYFGLLEILWTQDATKICIGIILAYFAAIFRLHFSLNNPEFNYGPYWFATELFLALGMIGTVVGMILVFANGGFTAIDLKNLALVREFLSNMTYGISTALYTTLVGLVLGNLLKVYLILMGKNE